MAEKLGFSLSCSPTAGFPGTNDRISGASYEGPEHELTRQRVDVADIIRDRTPRKILLNGYFQNYRNYAPYYDRIRHWMRQDEATRANATAHDLVVHVRRGDYIGYKWALPFEYYEEAITKYRPPNAEVWIATDDRNDPFFNRFRQWRPKYIKADDRTTIAIMARARVLVMSRSSYSWWPAILSEGGQAVCPAPRDGFWSRKTGSEIDLIDRGRFICLECDGTYQPTAIERGYQIWRSANRKITQRINSRFKTKTQVHGVVG